ncbi:MAG: tetratricopeptide repeat protein [Opitutaceae bacterium]
MKKTLNILLCIAALSSATFAQAPLGNPAASMWNDAEFVKSFTASYGVLAGYEPEISDTEKDALRGLLNIIKSNPANAIQQLEPQIKSSSSAAFDFILANLYFQQNNLSNAEKYYRNAIRKYPNFRRAHKNLGLVLVQANKFAGAAESLSKALELGDVDGRAYGLIGYCYLTEKLYYPSEAAYRVAILMQPKVRDWQLGLARCLIETEKHQEAISLFDSLLKQEPDNADLWLLQANAYIGINKTLAAAQNFELVRRMGKASIPMLSMLGDIYVNNAMPGLALSAYLEAIQKAEGQNPPAIIRAAKIFVQSGSYEEAQKLITSIRSTVAKLKLEDDLILLTLEARIARAKGENERALQLLTQIVERDALNGDALIELGNYYASQNDMARAVNRFEQAQLIEQFERPALVAHAQTLVRNGNYKAALPLLRRALELKSDSYLEDYTQRVEQVARSQS